MNRRDFLAGSLAMAAGIGATGATDSPRKTYRVAAIGRTGKGDYGHDLDLVWLDIPAAEIVAVADESEEGRKRAVERLKAAASYADYREMLRKEKPDLVSICPRWPDLHREMALACAEAGVKGVLMEKPLARTLVEADAIVAACERTGMKMAVCHQTRYSPRLPVVKQLIADGRIGDLLEIRTRGKEDARGGGEDLMVLGDHLFDLMRFIAGDPQWCFARVTQSGKPAAAGDVHEGGERIGKITGDAIAAMYGFAGPLVGHFGSYRTRHAPGARFGTHVYGSKGVISIGHGPLPPVHLLEDPAWTLNGVKWTPISSAGVGQQEPIKESSMRFGNGFIARDLIECVEKKRQPVGSVYDGRAALEMILAVYASHVAGRPVDLPLKERGHPLER